VITKDISETRKLRDRVEKPLPEVTLEFRPGMDLQPRQISACQISAFFLIFSHLLG
jgi:hypothetical protein